ncbi:VWA domain-containing protein [Dactylosporangium sp. CA-139066]|uniref:vWA domain-containing protein n=1 Tax=Dactylosporangium sp. CA-139066 TaxID=3239930 RepID=UPI003D930F77
MMSSQDHRVVAVPPRGLVRGQHVGVPAAGPDGPAVLSVAGGRTLAVVAHRQLDVPAGVLAVGEDLRDEANLQEGTQWRLEPRAAVDAGRIVLELSTERRPEDVADDIAGAGLVGTVLWVPAAEDDLWLDVADVPYRVLQVDVAPARNVLARIGPRTVVELFAPGVRAGVDIVVLADCSGSMQVDDIPVPRESMRALRGQQHMTRMEALQEALLDLLAVRLQVAGRISRIALVSFEHTTEVRFPRGGGMAQLDASAPPEVISQFREAVSLLRPRGGTAIGNALHAAGDLLYQHGHQGNERLVVLVSDGAEWAPTGDLGTGEIIDAESEPVSMMEHLHTQMGIRLHAIGLSTRELFLRRYAHRPGITPDHELLEELVKVGGGDPTTIGGLEVLAEYFSGVGAGITHRVRRALSTPPRMVLDEQARRILHDSGRAGVPATGVLEHVEAFGRALTRAEAAAPRVLAASLLTRRDSGMRAMRELQSATSEGEFLTRMRRVPRLLRPMAQSPQPGAVRELEALLEQLQAMLAADPADLDGVARVCAARGTAPGALVTAVAVTLTALLQRVAEELERMPAREAGGAGAAPPPRRPAPTEVGFTVRD